MSMERPPDVPGDAAALRARFRAAAPSLAAEPAPIIARARRRRRQVRAWGAAGVVAALVAVAGLGTALGGLRPQPVAPPPEPPSAVRIWLSADRVPPGAEMVAIAVNDTAEERGFGSIVILERWDGTTWATAGGANLCLPPGCVARLQAEVPTAGDGWSVSPVPGHPSVPFRFSTDGLAEGWYRIAGEWGGQGVFEVADDAPSPAPLWPLDGSAVLVLDPALIGPGGGQVRVLDTDVSGEAAPDAAVQRWADGTWQDVALVSLASDPAAPGDSYVDLPDLEPGAYRLAAAARAGGSAVSAWGNFWVEAPADVPLQEAVILDTYAGHPAGVDSFRTAFGAVVHPADGTIEVFTRGSSSCAAEPTAVEVRAGTVIVHLGPVEPPDDEQICTADDSPLTFLIAIPDGVPRDPPPPVEVRDRSSGDLIARAPDRPGPDDPQICVPEMTDDVCALNLWLDQLLAPTGPTTAGEAQLTHGSRAVVVDGVVQAHAEAYVTEAAPEAARLEVTQTYDTGEVVIDWGRFTGPVEGFGGQIRCGVVTIRIVAPTLGEQAAGEMVAGVGYGVTGCPDDVQQLVDRYAGWMSP